MRQVEGAEGGEKKRIENQKRGRAMKKENREEEEKEIAKERKRKDKNKRGKRWVEG